MSNRTFSKKLQIPKENKWFKTKRTVLELMHNLKAQEGEESSNETSENYGESESSEMQ